MRADVAVPRTTSAAIAQDAVDKAIAARVLDDLIMDKRRGRAGFPAEVTKDLLKLRILRPMIVTAMPDSRPSSPWDDVNMAAGDR